MTAIAALRLIAPLSALYVAWTLLATARNPEWTPFYTCSLVYASLEVAFFTCVYLPRRYHLQKARTTSFISLPSFFVSPNLTLSFPFVPLSSARVHQQAANHPTLSREERRALFQRCTGYDMSGSGSGDANDYPSGWFFRARGFHRENVLEWLLWALFSTPMSARNWWAQWEAEIDEYVAAVERVLGQALPEGYNEATPCMRLTFDPVRMAHRPLLWYLIVGGVDVVTCVRLYWLGFRHYSDKRLFQSFPPRPLTLFSRTSNVQGISYWYRPHRSLEEHPVLFLHGIGIGLYPYTGFLADLASHHPDIGILIPEFLSISSRITSAPLSRPSTTHAIQTILDTHALAHVVVVAHSYGTALGSHLMHTPAFAPRIAAMLLVDPIPFLLHLPDVAFNFVYRAPRDANEWLLWYFASRDPDVARTLARHFFWAENVLWREELEGRKVAVVLCGQDQVVNAEAVRRYLTGEEEEEVHWCGRGGLEVLYFPELDHEMVFMTRRRWRRLMGVLDRFVRVLG